VSTCSTYNDFQGANSHGQLGIGSSSEEEPIPVIISNFDPIIGDDKNLASNHINLIIGGGQFTLFSINNSLFGAGANDKSQFSPNLQSPLLLFHTLPPNFLPSIDIKKLSCGWDFTLALLSNGDVYGWGSNQFGQLGIEGRKEIERPTKLNVSLGVDISCGLRHSAVATLNGVFTSGSNRKGQLGVKGKLNTDYFVRGRWLFSFVAMILERVDNCPTYLYNLSTALKQQKNSNAFLLCREMRRR